MLSPVGSLKEHLHIALERGKILPGTLELRIRKLPVTMRPPHGSLIARCRDTCPIHRAGYQIKRHGGEDGNYKKAWA